MTHSADLITFVVVRWQVLICRREQRKFLPVVRSEAGVTEDMQNLGLEHMGGPNGRRGICEMGGGMVFEMHLKWWSRTTSGS